MAQTTTLPIPIHYSFKPPSAGNYQVTMGDDCSNASPKRQKVLLRGLMPHQKAVNFQLNDEYQNTSQICDATISTTEGLVKGDTVTAANGCKVSCVYKGIPYAKPPVRELRWQAPQPLSSRNYTLNATRFGDDCTQGPLLVPTVQLLRTKTIRGTIAGIT